MRATASCPPSPEPLAPALEAARGQALPPTERPRTQPARFVPPDDRRPVPLAPPHTTAPRTSHAPLLAVFTARPIVGRGAIRRRPSRRREERRSVTAYVAPGFTNASARSGSTAASRSSSAASGRSRRKACGAGWRRSGGAASAGNCRSSLTGTTVIARTPGWPGPRPTRFTSDGFSPTTGRASSPAHDGHAMPPVRSRRPRSAGGLTCRSRSRSGTWKDERTFPSSR